jgi:hypothetical protein
MLAYFFMSQPNGFLAETSLLPHNLWSSGEYVFSDLPIKSSKKRKNIFSRGLKNVRKQRGFSRVSDYPLLVGWMFLSVYQEFRA